MDTGLRRYDDVGMLTTPFVIATHTLAIAQRKQITTTHLPNTRHLQIDFFIVKFIYYEIQKNPADYF